jgi:hypothetical protein
MCHRVSSQLKRPEMKTIYALRRSKVHRKDKLLNKMKKNQNIPYLQFQKPIEKL